MDAETAINIATFMGGLLVAKDAVVTALTANECFDRGEYCMAAIGIAITVVLTFAASALVLTGWQGLRP